MIEIKDNIFHLSTKQTSYVFAHTKSGLLLHNYYGSKVDFYDYNNMSQKLHGGMGTAINYEGNEFEFLDNLDLEASFIGKGDYRESLISLYNDELGYTNNFKFEKYELIDNQKENFPMSLEPNQVLRIDLIDEVLNVKLELYYKVFEDCDVITKYIKLINLGNKKLTLSRCMSNQLDLLDSEYILMTFDGAWSKERHLHEQELISGIYKNDSKSGVSSNRHNPFFILKRKNTTQSYGEALGFNLVYSGNHCSLVEVTPTKKLRLLQGINPHASFYELNENDVFTTPEAVLTYTNQGLNQLSMQMHQFINNHIIRGYWKNKVRPILINNWEATYFNFDEKRLVELAKKAKDVGIELFVLDDGWFSKRNNDRSSLGDWEVNIHKLPNGLKGLCDKINKLGLKFGLWFEPEMINEDSKLYKTHPEFAIKIPQRKPSIGRNQLVLDLTNPKVQDFLIEKLTQILSSCNIEYIKWDFNRNITDMYSSTRNQGAFFHHYILGLYYVLEEITKRFPKVLFESCASGGNRFDLGMLCYTPQIWTSDNTDYLERVYIQTGTSYGYPLSTIGAHVSSVPNHQTLRNTPLSSRFHISCFGLLGYELDLNSLEQSEINTIKKQIQLYKKHRHILQYGIFYRSEKSIYNNTNCYFYCINKDKTQAIIGFFQELIHPSMSEDIIKISGLNDKQLYRFYNIKDRINLKIFGGLINLVMPIKIKLNGKIHNLITKIHQPKTEKEEYIIYGNALKHAGIRLHQQFMGTGYNNKVRVLGDFGTRLYVIETIK